MVSVGAVQASEVCMRGDWGVFLACDKSSVCLEQDTVFHNCCLQFASKVKVGGSRGRALWRAVDTGSYLLGAEIRTIFSSVLSPCTVVLMISSQLSTPPTSLGDEEEQSSPSLSAPWHRALQMFLPEGDQA